jgi:hypothetical protein
VVGIVGVTIAEFCADPANPKGIWFYGEFAAAVNKWGTWVGSAFFQVVNYNPTADS